MKTLFTFSASLLIIVGVFAQSPNKMSYQAVVRNSNNQLITNMQIGMQISILQGSESGTVVYTESQSPTTNDNGLVSIAIGEGNSGNRFSEIDWGNGPFFLKTEVDITGGSNFTITGTSQLLSVPYALYAKSAAEVDPVFEQWGFDYTQLINVPVAINAFLLNANGNPITNVADPTSDSDAATKAYIDEIVAYLDSLVRILSTKVDVIEEEQMQPTDIDGNTYKIARIGNQVWMAENLKVTKYADGTPIPFIEDREEWSDLGNNNEDKGCCWVNNNENGEKNIYGALYTYAAATNGTPYNEVNVQGACPSGWHLPSEEEFDDLQDFIKNDQDDIGLATGNLLKSETGWGDNGGTDNYGFKALPAGDRNSAPGTFNGQGDRTAWWSSTSRDPDHYAYQAGVDYRSNKSLGGGSLNKSTGLSVRCIRD